jgi:excisionase family DNA binding protein
MDRFLSRQQVADALGISVQTVDRHIAAGRLQAVKIGPRRVGIPDMSLQQYIDSITKVEDKR